VGQGGAQHNPVKPPKTLNGESCWGRGRKKRVPKRTCVKNQRETGGGGNKNRGEMKKQKKRKRGEKKMGGDENHFPPHPRLQAETGQEKKGEKMSEMGKGGGGGVGPAAKRQCHTKRNGGGQQVRQSGQGRRKEKGGPKKIAQTGQR